LILNSSNVTGISIGFILIYEYQPTILHPAHWKFHAWYGGGTLLEGLGTLVGTVW
jgi:hypothetical protein